LAYVMKGPFSLDPFDPEINQQEARQILCWQSQVAFVGSWIDGQCAGEECGPRRRGNTMFEIGNTIVREKTGVRLTNAHRSEIAASRHLAHRCLNGLAAEMLGLEAGQRDATMPRLTGFSVFDD
jgi:hypothetical protein